MYFGNNEGVLEYDGIKWRLIHTPDDLPIRSLAINDKGKIFVGTRGNFGYLAPDSTGKLQYRSLLHKLKAKDLHFGDVWRTVYTSEGVYFQSSVMIFRYEEEADTMMVWHAEKDRDFHFLFYANEAVYVRQRGVGLKKMIEDRLVEIQGGEVFAEERIYFMTDFEGADA
ncbi:MAG: hypothetical protein JKY18_09320, partial [Flavobacteriales bacterium]|nr:hypothetical protein [Flavobacteriales bacterium]